MIKHAPVLMLTKLFAWTSCVNGIPPTCAAFKQHVKRAAFQGGHVWGPALVPDPVQAAGVGSRPILAYMSHIGLHFKKHPSLAMS